MRLHIPEKPLDRRPGRAARAWLIALVVLIVLLTGTIHFQTGPTVELSVFYLIAGAMPLGHRIQLDFRVRGKRYRPTLDLRPTAVNLKHAHKRVEEIKRRIKTGTFDFAHEFPDYKFIDQVANSENRPTFNVVADQFLLSIKGSVEFATETSYRKILGSFWRPRIGEKAVADIRYSDITTILGAHLRASRKIRNNVVSVCRLVFNFAVAAKIIGESPAEQIRSLKVQNQPPDPYTLAEAEAVIAGMRKLWGDREANDVEFGFLSVPGRRS